jgi:hypothetical protein
MAGPIRATKIGSGVIERDDKTPGPDCTIHMVGTRVTTASGSWRFCSTLSANPLS